MNLSELKPVVKLYKTCHILMKCQHPVITMEHSKLICERVVSDTCPVTGGGHQ